MLRTGFTRALIIVMIQIPRNSGNLDYRGWFQGTSHAGSNMHMKRIPFAVVWLACLVAGLLFGTPSRLTPDSFPITASQAHAESARHTDSRREHSDRAGWHDHADNDHRRGGRGNHGRGRGWDRDHVYDRDKGSRGERRGRGKGHGGWHGHRPGGGHGGGGPDGDDGGNGSGDGGSDRD